MEVRLTAAIQTNPKDFLYKSELYKELEHQCISADINLYYLSNAVAGLGCSDLKYISLLDYKDNDYCVSPDSVTYYDLINHLVKKHDCFSYNIVTGPKNCRASSERLSCLLNVLASFGIEVEENHIFYGSNDETSGYGAMIYFESQYALDVDCIIALNDDMALGVLRYCRKRNIQIPGELKVVGFDNSVLAASVDTTLTSIGSMPEVLVHDIISVLQKSRTAVWTKSTSNIFCRKSCGCIAAEDCKTDYVDMDGKSHNYEEDDFFTNRLMQINNQRDRVSLRSIYQSLSKSSGFDGIVETLKNSMQNIKPRFFALVLVKGYDAELTYLYDEKSFKSNERHLDSTVTFDCRQYLIPKEFLAERRHTLFFKELTVQNTLFGYIAYEKGMMDADVYSDLFDYVTGLLSFARQNNNV